MDNKKSDGAELDERIEVAKTLGDPLRDLCKRYGVPLTPSSSDEDWREVATNERIERMKRRGTW